MPKLNNTDLIQLISSMSKSEKRHFKLFSSMANHSGDLKYMSLFDILEKEKCYNEPRILQKHKNIKASQLPNLKKHLYEKILNSLSSNKSNSSVEQEIREMIGQAQLLQERSLYDQCVKKLEKAKKLAEENEQLELLLEILRWEKTVLSQTIGKDNLNRVDKIIQKVQEVNQKINNINSFTNLEIRLSSFYKKIGFIRDTEDHKKIQNFFHATIPQFKESELGFVEKLHLYALYVGYYFFIQDFEAGMRYAEKWVVLFDRHPEKLDPFRHMYIKGINNLLIAQSKLKRHRKFNETYKRLYDLKRKLKNKLKEDTKFKLLKYSVVHKFNRHFMLGDFSGGVLVFEKIKDSLDEYLHKLDAHSVIIMHYKIACLYFGKEDYGKSLHWLNRVIQSPDEEMREDIHCFARILSLICHYELGNQDQIEYYIISTYRYLLKKSDWHEYQENIVGFLKKLNQNTNPRELKVLFWELRENLQKLEAKEFENRAFIYFDIISWLDSKVENKPVEEIVRNKFRLKTPA